MAREHHMVRYWREVREIADEEGISVEEARGRWSDLYVRVGVKREGIRRRAQNIAIALTATAASTYCPFCRDDLGEDDLHACSRCNTRFHNECWGELGENCTTLGCAARRTVVRFTPRVGQAHAPQPDADATRTGICRRCRSYDSLLRQAGTYWACPACMPYFVEFCLTCGHARYHHEDEVGACGGTVTREHAFSPISVEPCPCVGWGRPIPWRRRRGALVMIAFAVTGLVLLMMSLLS